DGVVDSETKSGVVAGVFVKIVEMQRKVRERRLDRGESGRRQRLDILKGDAGGPSLCDQRCRRGQHVRVDDQRADVELTNAIGGQSQDLDIGGSRFVADDLSA